LDTSSSEESGACYIYGSVHIEIPRRDILEGLVERVDYVLLEGVNISGLWRLARKHPSIALGLLSLLVVQKLFKLWSWFEGRREGVKFVGDMEYVRDFFASRDPRVRVEFVDASLEELVATHRREFIMMSISSMYFLAVALYVICHSLLAPSLRSLSIIHITTLALYALVLALIPAIVIYLKALLKLIPARDRKLVDRVVELARRGRRVLVVRGRGHVPYIREELRKRGVDCEVLNPG